MGMATRSREPPDVGDLTDPVPIEEGQEVRLVEGGMADRPDRLALTRLPRLRTLSAHP
jgi:hypothetical protein